MKRKKDDLYFGLPFLMINIKRRKEKGVDLDAKRPLYTSFAYLIRSIQTQYISKPIVTP